MSLRKDSDPYYYSESHFEEDESLEDLEHKRRVRKLLEERLDQKRLREELEDELDDDFDWDEK